MKKTILFAIALGSLVACTREEVTTEVEQVEVKQEYNKTESANYVPNIEGVWELYETHLVIEGESALIETLNYTYHFQKGRLLVNGERAGYSQNGMYVSLTMFEMPLRLEWEVPGYAFKLYDGNRVYRFIKAERI